MHDETTPPAGTAPRRRRDFLKRALGMTAAGSAGLSALARPAGAAAASVVNDTSILNFALNLEYLEAEYYTFAVTGNSIENLPTPIATFGSGMAGPLIVAANTKVTFADAVIEKYANEIALDEQKHVSFIRAALTSFGVAPVARPTIDLLNSFHALGSLIGVPNFNPFADEVSFLLGAYIFEDVGVTAYHGAAPLLKNGNVLSAAAGILAVEAYHSGSIRTILNSFGQAPATEAISSVRRMLGGAAPDYGVSTGIVVADSNALAPSRTPREVLNIVYGGVNAVSGLFFPNGVNGPIH